MKTRPNIVYDDHAQQKLVTPHILDVGAHTDKADFCCYVL